MYNVRNERWLIDRQIAKWFNRLIDYPILFCYGALLRLMYPYIRSEVPKCVSSIDTISHLWFSHCLTIQWGTLDAHTFRGGYCSESGLLLYSKDIYGKCRGWPVRRCARVIDLRAVVISEIRTCHSNDVIFIFSNLYSGISSLQFTV